ncbi:MAG TPA: group II intron reverse transcriptase/maturase, partial [Candidatus Tectomicrobia bacterium]
MDAVDRLPIKRPFGRYHVVVEADRKGFVDTIAHGWLGRRWDERLEDGAFVRLIRKWRQAGVRDPDEPGLHPATGTPQGGRTTPPT